MLELEHIQKSFDGVPVLKDISLQVADGEIVSILGPSGCGKTTLLNLILGIVDADSGRICYDGQDLTRTPMEKRGEKRRTYSHCRYGTFCDTAVNTGGADALCGTDPHAYHRSNPVHGGIQYV